MISVVPATMALRHRRCYQLEANAIIVPVRQLITRLDDDLHSRLKERAAAEGRSVNALVVRILADEVEATDRRRRLRWRARAAGKLVVPPQPAAAPSRDALEAITRGSGTATSEALAAERAQR